MFYRRGIDKDTDFETMNGIISGLSSSTLCLGYVIMGMYVIEGML